MLKQIYTLCLVCLIYIGAQPFAHAKGELKLNLEPAISQEDKRSARLLNSEPFLQTILDEVNESISINDTISINFLRDEDRQFGPHYDPQTSQIAVPYHFWEYVEQGFKDTYKDDITDQNLIYFTQDVVIHTIYHELAHALIDINEIPITGREENAADEMAAILILQHFEQGDEIVLSAADFFSIEAQGADEISQQEMFGEHALDEQRFFNLLCLVYGHKEGPADDWVKDMNVDEDRLGLCVEDYEKRVRAWNILLNLNQN